MLPLLVGCFAAYGVAEAMGDRPIYEVASRARRPAPRGDPRPSAVSARFAPRGRPWSGARACSIGRGRPGARARPRRRGPRRARPPGCGTCACGSSAAASPLAWALSLPGRLGPADSGRQFFRVGPIGAGTRRASGLLITQKGQSYEIEDESKPLPPGRFLAALLALGCSRNTGTATAGGPPAPIARRGSEFAVTVPAPVVTVSAGTVPAAQASWSDMEVLTLRPALPVRYRACRARGGARRARSAPSTRSARR
jgi:hypothetical protein